MVRTLIENKEELVNCVAKQPPKKDDGQSPLQVALKTGALDIVEYLIDCGADLNYMEDESCCNEWRTPVIHLPTFNYSTNSESDDRIFTKELENDLLNVLNLLCKYGADISYVSPNTKRTVRDFYLGGSLSKLLSQI